MNVFLSYISRHKKILLFALVLSALNQVFSLLDPLIFRILIDDYASHAADLDRTAFLRGVIALLAASIGVAFASRTAKAFQDYFVQTLKQRVGTEMYADSIAHSFSLPYGVFEDQRSGELLGKLQRARDDSQNFIVNAINILFFSVIGILFVLVYATIVNWMIGLVYFLIIPILGVVTFFLSKKIKKIQQSIVVQTTALSGSMTETLRNVELVKSLGLEHQEVKRLNDTNEAILKLELEKVKAVRKLDFVQGTIINALRSGLMLLMLWLIFSGDISLGEFFSLLFYSFAIFNPLSQLGLVATSYQEAKSSTGELEKILAFKPEEEKRDRTVLGEIESIEYRNVGFSYATGGAHTLRDISFTIRPGETVAFVGPSGSGKSTIVKLLAGLYKPGSGSILFNGTDSADIDYDNLRNRMGIVSQETQLFAGSIRDNLLFVNPKASDADCIEALRQAAATPILERGGLGLDTKIGEGGIKISGGERQRLAIARALLRKPDILIFDEATSSLDSLTEKSIADTIIAVTEKRPELITIMIAHRLSTVVRADAIYVLEKGAIAENGRHSELVESGGLYGALWFEQSRTAESSA